MKTVLSLLTASVVLIPTTVMSQQVNYYQTCTAYREAYVPGYYDQYGNYNQGRVNIQSYQVNCGSSQPYQSYQQTPYYRQRVCNPVAGAALGAGLAEAISGGNGWRYNSNWSRNYNRNNYSGSYNYNYRNYGSNGWTLFGAGLGALAFSC